MKLLIFLDENALGPAGGPLGVGYYLHEQTQNRGLGEQIQFLRSNLKTKEREGRQKKILYKFARLTKIVRSLRHIKEYHSMLYKPAYTQGKFDGYDAIHFHRTSDMYKQRRNLEGYKGKVLLTSHSPIPLAKELYDACATKFERRYFKKRMHLFERMDEWSFRHADYIVFPCPEAEEPYEKNWPVYRDIQKDKKEAYRYVPTGISERVASVSKTKIRENLGIRTSDFMMVYVGRHNEVKGYGNLKKLGKKLLDEHNDMKMVVAGNEGPIMRLEHPSWVEIGFTKDPYSYIAASDVFVLPNTETYFDLVMIEVLSLGKIVVASSTGGNRYYEKMGLKGVFLYDTLEEAEKLILQIKAFSPEKKRELEEENRKFYKEHLSGECFFDHYLEMLEQIGLPTQTV